MPGRQHFIKNQPEIIFLLNIFLLSFNTDALPPGLRPPLPEANSPLPMSEPNNFFDVNA